MIPLDSMSLAFLEKIYIIYIKYMYCIMYMYSTKVRVESH